MFNQIKFQEELIVKLLKCWNSKSFRQRNASNLHCGKADKHLRQLGYSCDQASSIITDARDMAKLLLSV